MTKKLNIGILFGGKSAEHEVSLQSAKNVFEAIDKSKYNPFLIGITKQGKWILCDETNYLLNSDDPKLIKLNECENYIVLAPEGNGTLYNLKTCSPSIKIDIFFPVIHGPFAEDGTLQGLLKLANIPFVGPGVLGSAVGMDKDIMKKLLRDANIPIGKFITLTQYCTPISFEEATKRLGPILFIKPANMGSSVGVTRATNENEYLKGINDAFLYDTKILIEEFIKGREVECAILGNENPRASILGEVIPTHNFYSYDAKYIDENGASLKIPSELDSNTTKKIQEIAIKTFKTLCCEGLSRVDCFVTNNNEIFVNEINTIPGFTKISMYPKLWEASGISYTDLISNLIQLAIDRFEKEQGLLSSK